MSSPQQQPRLPDAIPENLLLDRPPGTQPLSWTRVSVISGAIALAVFAIGVGLDRLLLTEHYGWRHTLEISDALAGVVGGVLSFRLLAYERQRRREVHQRLLTIAEMNHHVRNALQVIQFSAYSAQDRARMKTISEGVERIQWALKEVLPKL